MASVELLRDSHGRTLRDLRVSITDRCDFRCLYCLPETEAVEFLFRERSGERVETKPLLRPWLCRKELLSFEEIERIVRLVTGMGIRKVRLTGGEPLLRNEIEKLIARLARIPGVEDLALTTNGLNFQEKATALQTAGLKRISFSLDSLDRANYQKITGRDGLEKVLAAIALALELGFHPVKANAVIIRGINDQEIESLAEFVRRQNLILRFIEFMPLDAGRFWRRDLVVPGGEILERLQARYGLEALPSASPSETAKRWKFADGRGEIGIITTITQPFCRHCNRLRLTADGKLRTCLFSKVEHDLRARMRSGASDEELKDFLKKVAVQKEDGHHIDRPGFISPERSMNCIGG